jgi:DnaJ-class molecular chaperone
MNSKGTIFNKVAGLYVDQVTRLEVIDSTPCKTCKGKKLVLVEGEKTECPFCKGMGSRGRAVVFRDDNKTISLSLQDDEKTLKIFIKERSQ